MSTNTIQVTDVDNEVYIIATSWEMSYQLCHIRSGNGNAVNVTVNITPGTFSEPATLNGVNTGLNQTVPVSLPSGSYNIIAVGIDWGGGQQIVMSVNGTQYGTGAYQPGPFSPSAFWNNNSTPTKITV